MKLLKPFHPLLEAPFIVWEYVLVALCLATFLGRAIAVGYEGLFSEKYSQLAIGDIAWTVGSKTPDYLVLLGFVVAFFLIYAGLRLLASAMQRNLGEFAEQGMRRFLVYSLIPAGIWIGNSFFNDEPVLDLVILSTVLLLLVLGFSGKLLARRFSLTSQDYAASVGSSVLSILFALLSGSAFVLAISRVNVGWRFQMDDAIAGMVAGFVSALLGLGFIWIRRSRSLSSLLKNLRWLLGLSQLGLPLCFSVLLPPLWKSGERVFQGYSLSPALYGFIAVLVVVSYFDVIRRVKGVRTGPEVFSVVSPICLVAVLVYIKAPLLGVQALPSDDYHWGEAVLPWWTLQASHAIPFQDYEPARGLVNYVPGLFANLFFNGDVSSYLAITSGQTILFTPFLLIALPILASAIGLLPAFLGLLLMPYVSIMTEIDLMVTVGLCIVAGAFLKQQWSHWLLIWVVLCVTLILFSPGNGGLLTIATFPLAAFAFYKAVRYERLLLWRGAIAIAIVLLTVGILTPLGGVMMGAIRYGAEQSSLNSVVYGYEWFKSRGSHTFLSYPLWELVRTAWIGIAVVVGLLIYQITLTSDRVHRAKFLVYAIPIFLLCILIIPRAAGRIDPGAISRLGLTSIWVTCLLLPIVLVVAFGQRGKALSLLVVAILGSLLSGIFPSFSHIVQQSVAVNDVAQVNLVDGKPLGLPAINHVTISDPAHWQRLQKVKVLMNALLEPGETYLDLTNRNAQYFYLGYPTPILSGAVYNLVHEQQQLRAVRQLEKTLPPVVFASDNASRLSGSQIALRTHLVYRYVSDRYIPVAVNEFLLFIRRDRLDRLDKLASEGLSSGEASPFSIVPGQSGETRLNLLDHAFRIERLEGVPSSWGRSFRSLQTSLQKVQDISPTISPILQGVEALGSDRYRRTAATPSLTFDLSKLNLTGQQAGILGFDFACQGRQKADVAIQWSTASSPISQANQVFLKAHKGKQLVPLDALPRWLQADGIQSIQISPFDASCPTFSLSNVTLFQRKIVAEMPE